MLVKVFVDDMYFEVHAKDIYGALEKLTAGTLRPAVPIFKAIKYENTFKRAAGFCRRHDQGLLLCTVAWFMSYVKYDPDFGDI